MPCPNCGNKEDRLIVKNGHVYRKKENQGKGAKICRYLCTKCGFTARGSRFGLPEETTVKPEGEDDES